MLNRAEIIGRLTRDPELRYTPTGKPVAQLAIATNAFLGQDDGGERREAVEYHDVVLWGPQAETVAKYLAKGRLVFIEGRLQTRSWEHEGITRRRTEDRGVAGPVPRRGEGRHRVRRPAARRRRHRRRRGSRRRALLADHRAAARNAARPFTWSPSPASGGGLFTRRPTP